MQGIPGIETAILIVVQLQAALPAQDVHIPWTQICIQELCSAFQQEKEL